MTDAAKRLAALSLQKGTVGAACAGSDNAGLLIWDWDAAIFDLDESDYWRDVDGKPRCDGVASFLEPRNISLPRGDPSDPAERETVVRLGNRKNAYFQDSLEKHCVEVFESTVTLIRRLRVPVSGHWAGLGHIGVRNHIHTLQAGDVLEFGCHVAEGGWRPQVRTRGAGNSPEEDAVTASRRSAGGSPR